jgi:glycosyltransferase involved in cell wall biosynthesis
MTFPTHSRITIYHNILWSKYKGGVFSHVHSLALARGVDVSVTQIAETEGQRMDLAGIDLSYHTYPYRLLFRGSQDNVVWYKRIFAAANDIYKNPSDLVVLPGYHKIEYWAMLITCILLRRRRAVFSDSTPFDKPEVRWRELAKRIFFARCHGCFTYGARSKEYLMSYGVDESKIHIRRQAAALPHDYEPSAVMERYERMGEGKYRQPRFVFIGRLAVEKGLFDLLRAFRLVRAKLHNARLDLVGAGPLMDDLKREAATLGLEDSVNLLGSKDLDALVPVFYDCVAMVLPSHSEPWGLVVNESLSYGCPVVVSDLCGCVPELVIDGVTGYRFSTGNIDALAAAMVAVTRMSEDRLATAKECLNVISMFTPERAASQILDGCMTILGDRASNGRSAAA